MESTNKELCAEINLLDESKPWTWPGERQLLVKSKLIAARLADAEKERDVADHARATCVEQRMEERDDLTAERDALQNRITAKLEESQHWQLQAIELQAENAQLKACHDRLSQEVVDTTCDLHAARTEIDRQSKDFKESIDMLVLVRRALPSDTIDMSVHEAVEDIRSQLTALKSVLSQVRALIARLRGLATEGHEDVDAKDEPCRARRNDPRNLVQSVPLAEREKA